ncbi:MAG TPA: flagellar hook-associated protein FlgK [Solirubrobacteraceae bacterium]|jgi:flagellar hook-associated protein 1 FlgK|nr:flagellar hook-associated protein FlgK [Solirubrobacteraceae bacterium]
MSIPTLQGLQTALSGLLAEQQALDITGNNIANSNTEGYSRETVVMQPSPPIVIPALSTRTGEGAQLGTGVSVATYTRIRNSYLDAQYRTQNSALSASSTQAEELVQAQSAFNEPSSTGIASQMSAFWTAWSSLANSPTSEAAKQGVVSAAQQLTTSINQLSGQLTTIAGQVGEQVSALTGPGGEVQNYANQIAQLNGQIKLAEQAGQQPNAMLDQRDLLLDKLSSLAKVTVSQQPDGTDTVSFGDASKPLVEGTSVNWPQTITAAAGGQLGALLGLTSPTGALTALSTSLDGVAGTLAETVNALHTSTPIFSGTTAATLKVAVTAVQVKASSSEAVGGNAVALAIANLRGGAAEQGYAALVQQVGASVRTAQDEEATAKTTLTTIGNQRQSVSGVSLDEEMTNLISFQRGYQASARTLTAMDSMLETLIEHTGQVGL